MQAFGDAVGRHEGKGLCLICVWFGKEGKREQERMRIGG